MTATTIEAVKSADNAPRMTLRHIFNNLNIKKTINQKWENFTTHSELQCPLIFATHLMLKKSAL